MKGIDSLPEEHKGHIVDYGKKLTDCLVKVVMDALAARHPAKLEWGQGTARFAANRRVLEDGKWAGFGAVPDGPVDHSLPVLKVTDTRGKLVAVVVDYACHATTLRGNFTKIHGDWPACAAERIEADHPGAVAMITIGCGADSDPCPHGTVERAEKHGREVAAEVKRLLQGPLTPIDPTLRARREVLDLATKKYTIATWTFGDDLAMVFLTGEVVVDYALRLKRELDGKRLWLTAYAHDVPCYIASKRILKEGGYEARNSLSARISPGRPEDVKPAVEDRIVEKVRGMLGSIFANGSESESL